VYNPEIWSPPGAADLEKFDRSGFGYKGRGEVSFLLCPLKAIPGSAQLAHPDDNLENN
jgi:hypothetical protein